MKGYVYALYEDSETNVVYIGSSKSPENRLKDHNLASRNYIRMQSNYIEGETYLPDKPYGSFIVDEIEYTEAHELMVLEIYWIHQFSQWGFNLLNKNFYINYDFNFGYKKTGKLKNFYPRKFYPIINKNIPKMEMHPLALQEDYVSQNEFSFRDEILRQQVRCEENCLSQLLKDFLKREPTIEDVGKCSMVYREGVHDRYTFTFLGMPLGEVIRTFEGCKFTVTFYPIN